MPDSNSKSHWQAQLEALGYVHSAPVAGRNATANGVVLHQPGAVSPGLNLFNSRDEAEAQLMTLDGRVVHRWRSDIQGSAVDLFERALPSESADHFKGWNLIELLPGGDLVAIGSHHMLLRLDWNSKLVWKLDIAAHHDLAVDPAGDIHVLTDDLRTTTVEAHDIVFQDNLIVRVSPDGALLGQISLFDALREEIPLTDRLMGLRKQQIHKLAAWRRSGVAPSPYQQLYRAATRGEGPEDAHVMNVIFHSLPEDLFHANSLQVVSSATPGWRSGDYLVSILRLDTVALIDRESGRVKWSWGPGELDRPHHATQLANGDVLIFDNGPSRGWSRIVRLDPNEREVVWSYQADPPEAFYSRARGGAQLLANGNVLIAETDKGRAFEVTPEGEVVWEYFNPVETDGAGESRRAAIYRMTRLAPDQLDALVPQLGLSATRANDLGLLSPNGGGS